MIHIIIYILFSSSTCLYGKKLHDTVIRRYGVDPVGILQSARLNYSSREIAVSFPLARNLIDNKVKIREY